MKNFNPRHLRKKFSNKSGESGSEKKMAFRRAKQISDKFIHQSAEQLSKPALALAYAKYCAATSDGSGLRNKAI